MAENLYWLEQTAADVLPENNWLSAVETVQLSGLRFPKRRGDWRLGRWTAKRAVAVHLNLPVHSSALAAIEIRPAADGAPDAFLAGRPAALAISLSHCAGTAICAVMPSPAAVGCDLEMIEPRSEGFFDDYFTAEEKAMVARTPEAERPWLLTLLWSAKESALKALRVGLRADTRSVIVSLIDPGPGSGDRENAAGNPVAIPQHFWSPLRVDCENGRVFRGWWRRTNRYVYTVVADPPPAAPILLDVTQASC
ncbi:MAG: 4'-phosphopantetheinyl transferase superfamily protein [Candidatus Korobacteraceae bacterium]